MILTLCWTHSVQSYTIETISMFFALLLRSANQACTKGEGGGGGGGQHPQLDMSDVSDGAQAVVPIDCKGQCHAPGLWHPER